MNHACHPVTLLKPLASSSSSSSSSKLGKNNNNLIFLNHPLALLLLHKFINSSYQTSSKMSPFQSLPLFFLLLLHSLTTSSSSSTSTLPNRYFKSIPISLRHHNISNEYFELTKPFPSDPLNPSCNHLLLLQQDFGNTIGLPPVSVPYSPPEDCPAPWNQIILDFQASCKGEQYDRISGIWLDGVEILRTSTAEPTEAGIFWKVKKDVTRYSSLFSRSNLTLTMMLENVVNDVYTGVYHVNVSLLYYNNDDDETRIHPPPPPLLQSFPGLNLNRKIGALPDNKTVLDNNSEKQSEEEEAKLELGGSTESGGRKKIELQADIFYEKPADLIIPISADGNNDGCWFRIQNELDVHSKGIQIPQNTYKAVLEVYVSFHGNDEFWYSNPPNSYIAVNNLTTKRGNGAFRQVFATIDGVLVGSTTPFPVIFTGGINPLFWEPVVAIGAFNLPTYDLDLTAFLGIMLDGNSHSFGLGVTDSLPFWLVDANLHLWLDPKSSTVQANSVFKTSEPYLKRESKFKNLDGSFEIEAKKKTEVFGWINSSMGSFTTYVSEEFKFKNEIKFKEHGQHKEVEQKIKVKTELRVESDTGELIHRAIIKRKFPLSIKSSTRPGSEKDTYLSTDSLSHAWNEKTSFSSLSKEFTSSISNRQDSEGWMVVKDHSVLSGTATTKQTLSCKGENSCYTRSVSAADGKLLEDISTADCAFSS